ncbi:MAG: MaoC family dehydratase [Pedobacter sp.]|nr:MAG: MaoC family dehydratase [Pedobacter sp.]
MIIISNHAEFEAFLGQELGISDWHLIDQAQVNKFADATLDHQWIHIDEERALLESPFQKTIAHGYLTLSLVPYLWKQIAEIRNLKMEINYGIESFKFGVAVTVNSRVRLHTKLKNIINLRGISKITIEASLEIEGQNKPAFIGDLLFLYHFNN